jgi:hypothetical protein
MPPRRLTRIAIAGLGEIVGPPPLLTLLDDAVSTPVSTSLLVIDVLAGDTPAGDIKLLAVHANAPLPAANVSVIGTAPSQQAQVNLAGLAAGTYTFSYDAALISDPTVAASAIVTLTVTAAVALPVADIRALSSNNRAEGSDGSVNKTWVFAAARTGDLTPAGSVAWALEGTLTADDMPAGQATSGTLSWAAGDGSEQRVTIALLGDTTVEADETLRIRISSPVGCTIGTATAELTVKDDDTTTTPPGASEYDGDLPYGGTMLGAAIQDGAVGNIDCRGTARNCAIVMYLESLKPILCIGTENRVDHFPLGATAGGYSDHTVVRPRGTNTYRAAQGTTHDPASTRDATSGVGVLVDIIQRPTGGDLQWRVAKVIGPNEGQTSTLVLEKKTDGSVNYVGQTPVIKKCARDDNWQDQWEKSGGTGNAPGRFTGSTEGGGYPTIWFDDPIDPVAEGWQIGDRIAFVISNMVSGDTGPGGDDVKNLAPDESGNNRWTPGPCKLMSVNQCYRKVRPVRKSTYRYLAYSGTWWDSFSYIGKYAPVLLVGHDAGAGKLLVKGNAYVGNGELTLGDKVQLRQIIRIPDQPGWKDRKIKGADVSLWRNSSTTTGNVLVSIRRAGSTIGGQNDNGTLLGSKEIAASAIHFGDIKNDDTGADPHVGVGPDDLSTTADLTVQPGEAYYITFEPSTNTPGANFSIALMFNYQGRTPAGLKKADHQDTRNKYQRRTVAEDGTGGTWADVSGQTDALNYDMLGCALHFDV